MSPFNPWVGAFLSDAEKDVFHGFNNILLTKKPIFPQVFCILSSLRKCEGVVCLLCLEQL